MEKYSKTLGDDYWAHWVPYTFEEALKSSSWVDPEKMKEEANRIGMVLNKERKEMLKYLKEGAELGAVGESRLPTSQRNCSSVVEEGAKMGDMIQVLHSL